MYCKQFNRTSVICLLTIKRPKVLFQVIQFRVSHLVALSLNVNVHSVNVKLFYLINRQDPIRYYHSGIEWTWDRCLQICTLHCPNFQNYQSITIRLFRVISWILVGGVLTPLQSSCRCILQFQPTGLESAIRKFVYSCPFFKKVNPSMSKKSFRDLFY